MVLGFNHNIKYKGDVYHVQTEDSGVANPHIITLLYKGGVIIFSQKTSYADILKMDNLEEVVEELMKEQHKGMMRRLKQGDFDERALAVQAATFENYGIEAPQPADDPVADIFSATARAKSASARPDVSLLFEMPAKKPPVTVPASSTSPAEKRKAPGDQVDKNVLSLDDAILTFFGANEK